MENSIYKLTGCLMLAFPFLVLFTPSAFADENTANADHTVYRANQVSNNYGELMGLLKQMNQKLEQLSGQYGQAKPVAVRASIPSKPSAKRGKAIFHEMQCISCHGINGKGHEAKTNMKDERGLPIMAADLTQPSSFGNGNSRKDIFRTVMTGLDGSPMPSFVDLFVGEEHRAWDLVEYVYSLQEDTLARFLP